MGKKDATGDLLAQTISRLRKMGARPYFSFGELFHLSTLIVFSAQMTILFTREELDSTTFYRVLTETSGLYICTLKTWYMYRNSKKIHEIRDFIKNEMEVYESHLPLESMKIEKRRAGVAKGVCSVVIYLTTVLFYSAAFLPVLSFFMDGTEKQPFTILVGPESLILKTDIGYITFWAIFSIHIYIITNGFLAFDILYVMSCHYISSKSMKLCAMLEEVQLHVKTVSWIVKPFSLRIEDVLPNYGIDGEKLIPATEDNFSGWSGGRHDEEIIYAALVRCVKYNQKICWLRDRTEEICSFPILNDMLICSLHVVLPIMRVLGGVEERAGYVYIGFYFAWNFLNVAYICLWGDQITEKSEEVADAAFSIYSPGMCSKRIRVALELVILKAQRPLYLSAAGLFKICSPKLSEVAQQSYSLMCFLLKCAKLV